MNTDIRFNSLQAETNPLLSVYEGAGDVFISNGPGLIIYN